VTKKTWKYREDFERWFLLINDVDETLLEKLDDGFYKDDDINLMYGAFHAGLEIERPPTPAARTTKPPKENGMYWVKFRRDFELHFINVTLNRMWPNQYEVNFPGIRQFRSIFDWESDIVWRSVEPVTEPEWGPIDGKF
jgi:hypothetical protein